MSKKTKKRKVPKNIFLELFPDVMEKASNYRIEKRLQWAPFIEAALLEYIEKHK